MRSKSERNGTPNSEEAADNEKPRRFPKQSLTRQEKTWSLSFLCLAAAAAIVAIFTNGEGSRLAVAGVAFFVFFAFISIAEPVFGMRQERPALQARISELTNSLQSAADSITALKLKYVRDKSLCN